MAHLTAKYENVAGRRYLTIFDHDGEWVSFNLDSRPLTIEQERDVLRAVVTDTPATIKRIWREA